MSEKRHILVVDDEAYITDVLCRRLERLGFSVQAAVGFAAAGKALELQPADLIICDVQIESKRTAADVFSVARARNPKVRLVAMSGHTRETPVVQQVLAGNVDIFLKKPFASLKEASLAIAALLPPS